MIVRHGATVGRPGARQAWISLWALFGMTTLLAALAVALNAGWLGTARIELQAAADSAALAGVGELVSDEWLRQGQPGVADLLASVPVTSQTYAGLNRALGQKVVLAIAPSQGGDVQLGTIGATGPFVPADLSNPTTVTLAQVNAVNVAARRLRSRHNGVPVLLGALALLPATDVQAMVAAQLNLDVVGFQIAPGQSIPLVPIGVQSDPSGTTPTSWENQIFDRNGPDQFAYLPGQGFTPSPTGDGIPEIDLAIPLAMGNAAASNTYLLSIGSGSLAEQIQSGVSYADLAAQYGPPSGPYAELVMDSNNVILLPGSRLGPAMNTPEYTQLVDTLDQLQQLQVQRIWPLVSGIDPVSGDAVVNAFVAARVVRVVEAPGGPLTIRLQPTMLAVPQAVTDTSREGAVYLTPSPYLAKARLVR